MIIGEVVNEPKASACARSNRTQYQDAKLRTQVSVGRFALVLGGIIRAKETGNDTQA